MTTKFNFVWIDDSPDRAQKWIGGLDTSLMGNPVSADLEVVAVTEDFLIELDQRVTGWATRAPDLVMLDHNLSKVNKRLYGMHGSALAHLLRIQMPSTPIVCVSGQRINSDEFNAEDISEYTYLFDVNELHSEENLENLFAIAQDFRLLSFPPKQPVRHTLVDLLKAPHIDQSALISILPEEFEGTFVHSTSPHRVARWILNVLMRRPGFLYDTLEVATLLGLTEKAFEDKVKPHFEPARYQGPFRTEARPLWWASALSDVLYETLPQHAVLSPQEAGRLFEGIEEKDFSHCEVTGRSSPPPDVVAFTDSTKAERRAVRHSFTVPLSEESSSLLGFSTSLKIRNDRKGA